VYGIIYKATGPDGRVYIGQTTESLTRRKGVHAYRIKKGDKRSPFQFALLEHGSVRAFQWEQIDTAENAGELDAKEKHWIAHYQSDKPAHGYNSTDGGINYTASPEHRKKLSDAHKEQIPWNKGKAMPRKEKKVPELSPEALAANREGEARREKEKQARLKNAEKQKRFRESMKAIGYKRVTLWGFPCQARQRMADMGLRQVPAWEHPNKTAETSRTKKIKCAVNIHEKTLYIAARQPEIKAALQSAAGSFLRELGGSDLSKEKQAVYNDFMEIIKLIGDPWAHD